MGQHGNAAWTVFATERNPLSSSYRPFPVESRSSSLLFGVIEVIMVDVSLQSPRSLSARPEQHSASRLRPNVGIKERSARHDGV